MSLNNSRQDVKRMQLTPGLDKDVFGCSGGEGTWDLHFTILCSQLHRV